MKKSTLLVVGLTLQSLVSFAQNISTIAGTGTPGFSGDGGAATAAKLATPEKAVADAAGNVYIADYGNHRIRKINTSGVITTICGDGTCDTTGNGGPATAATICGPVAMAIDGTGNLYITDFVESMIRKISSTGIITRFAGNGDGGYYGDGTLATSAAIGTPTGVAVDAAGNVYIADFEHDVIRKVNTSGIISTVAGTGVTGSSADGASATMSPLNGVMRVAVDGVGNIYIAEVGTGKVRKVNTSGILSTVASGIGVLDVAIDGAGNIYYSSNDSRIRKTDGVVQSIIAGTGSFGYSGDGGPATLAMFNMPQGLSVSAAGDIYVADKNNMCIRKFASGTAGVDLRETSTISVYPNPSNGKFSISLPYGGTKHVAITDAFGKTVLQQVCESNEFGADLNGAPVGNYFISVITDGAVYHSQLVVW